MTPKLSIVTCTRNRPESYKRFLTSVFNTVSGISFEIVIANASDKDGWLPYSVKSETVRVFSEQPRLGPLRGYNRVFRECRGEYVVWFNDDCELIPGWCEIALEFMEHNFDVGIGCIYFSDKVQRGKDGKTVFKTRLAPGEAERLAKEGKTTGDPSAKWVQLFEVQSLYGIIYANFGILRRELGDEIGWFDESLGWMYGCDNDLCLEVIARGHAVVPIPDCKVLHYRERDDERNGNRAMILNDRRKFDAKWKARTGEMQQLMQRHKHLVPDTKYL